MNGVSSINDMNLLMRGWSYMMMLGDIKGVREIIKEQCAPITPLPWYEP